MSNLISDSRYSSIEEKLKQMYDRQMEFCQTRSKFQISKFICCDEYTLTSKYRSISHNSYVALQEVKRLLIQKERLIDKLNEISINELTLDKLEYNMQLDDLEIRIKGLLKEIDYMEQICSELEKQNGKPFTYEQLEAEEPEYWRRRLAGQMHNSQIGNQYGIGEGNYHSYLMALEESPLKDNKQIEPINIQDINAIATIALKDREGVNKYLLTAAPNPKPDTELIHFLKDSNCLDIIIKYAKQEITYETYVSMCIQRNITNVFTKEQLDSIQNVDELINLYNKNNKEKE